LDAVLPATNLSQRDQTRSSPAGAIRHPTEARRAGIKDIIFVTSRGKGALKDYLTTLTLLETELRSKAKL